MVLMETWEDRSELTTTVNWVVSTNSAAACPSGAVHTSNFWANVPVDQVASGRFAPSWISK